VKFLKNPKISKSPLFQRKAFLKSKGLTDDNIQLACDQAGILNHTDELKNAGQDSIVAINPPNYPIMTQTPHSSWLVKLRDFGNFVLVLGGAAYGVHYLWKVKLQFVNLTRLKILPVLTREHYTS
jgi:peroxin-14